MEAISKVKNFYHKVHKDFSQSTQGFVLRNSILVYFVLPLCSLW